MGLDTYVVGFDSNGREIEIPYEGWSDGDLKSGIEIKVEEIPKGVKVIRFINSY